MQRIIAAAGLSAIVFSAAVHAQDIRGLEICTAEKSMERRTSCLQSNVEFLQQALAKQARDIKARLDAGGREAKAQQEEMAALKVEVAALRASVAEPKKAKPAKK
jgi:hypothetical protein